MARSKGTAIFAVNFEPTGQAPLDARLVVNTVADLTAAETYADKNYYKGMTVTVADTGEIYVLMNPDQITETGSWHKSDASAVVQVKVINDLTTGGTADALSAEQGKVLKGLIDGLTTKVGNDPVPDQISEAVSAARTTIDAYTVNGKEISSNPTLTKSDVGLGNVTNEAQIPLTQKGANDGVATLDSTGKVPSSQLPSYVDDVIEAENFEALPGTGEAGKIYVTLDDNKTYRWSGSAYTEISASLALGETTSTAYAGDKGAANRGAIESTPDTVVSSLGNATADADSVNIPVNVATKSGLNYGEPAAGTPITIPLATGSAAGLMSPSEKTSLATLTGSGAGSVDKKIADAVSGVKGDVTGDGDTLGKLEDRIELLEGADAGAKVYNTTATTGNSLQVLASTHNCGTNILVQTFYQNSLVDCDTEIAENGDVTVAWNGSIVSVDTPLTIRIVG